MKRYMAKRLWKLALSHKVSDGGWITERAVFAAKICGNIGYGHQFYYPC